MDDKVDSLAQPLADKSIGATALHALLDKLPCAVFACRFASGDSTPVYNFIGANVDRVLGLSAEAMQCDPKARFGNVLAEDVAALEKSVAAALAHGGFWNAEFRVRVGGAVRWIEGRAQVETSADGGAVAHGCWIDVSERKAREIAYRETHERLRRIFDAAPQSIGISDAAGNVKALNPQYTKTFGFTPADLRTLDEVFEKHFPDPAHRARVVADWRAAVAESQRTGAPTRVVTSRMRRKDGSECVVEVRSAVAGDETIVMFNDVTARVVAERGRSRAEADRDMLLDELHLQTSRLPMALVITDADPDRTIRDWNPSAERIFGYRREEVVGKSPLDFLIPAHRKTSMREVLRANADSRETVRAVNENLTKDGRRIWCEWFSTPVVDDAGNVIRVMSMAQDVTERVHAEERMRLWTSVLDHSTEGILICDAERRILLVNAAFCELTGYAEEEVLGKTPRILKSGRQDTAFYARMWEQLNATGQWHGEMWNRRKNGELYAEWLSISAVRDTHGAVTHYVGIFSDITKYKESEERIRRLVQYDALTDLPNRALFGDRLGQLVKAATRDDSRLAVLYVDLDRFKDVNDSLGHDAGDRLLIAMTQRMTEVVREADTIARMGADEFAVALAHLHRPEDAAEVALKLLSAIKQPLTVAGAEVTSTASIGICVFPNDAVDSAGMIRNADAAMYQAKTAGRDAYRFYTRDMNDRALERLSTENALRRAIANEEFVLHYQPQVDLGTGATVGAEALIRWQRPGVGLVPPGEFIPIAEDRGLITRIGRWAIETAARQAAAWNSAGIAVPVAVNLSAVQFHERGFVEHIAATLRAQRLPPGRLELELTESIIVRDADGTVALLEQLHDLGAMLSIDDFGTGYSSLNYLRRFPIDKIKIDKSFVGEIGEHADTTRIIIGIIALAKSLELTVLAEGVETDAQRAMLQEHGCDQAQGFLYSPAVPPEKFEDMFRRRERA